MNAAERREALARLVDPAAWSDHTSLRDPMDQENWRRRHVDSVTVAANILADLDALGLMVKPDEGEAPLVVHHHDIEKHAEHFNEGWDEAHRQGVGGSESREWLFSKVQPILAEWVDTAYRTTIAGYKTPPEPAREMRYLHLTQPEIPTARIADALLSDADLGEARA